MSRRPFSKTFALLLFGGCVAYGIAAEAAAPVLQSAASRKIHPLFNGTPTPFDTALTPAVLPYTLPSNMPAIECRVVTGAGGLTIVMTFDQAVVAGTPAPVATITASTGATGMTVAAPVFGVNTVSMTLSGLLDQHAYKVSLTNIAASDASGTLALAEIPFRTLKGDVNASGQVTNTDQVAIKLQNLKDINQGNFRCDIDASGRITNSDIVTTKLQNLKSANPAGAWPNTPPTITAVADQAATSGTTTSPIGFTVGDAESAANLLGVNAYSSDQTLLPNANISVGGTGASRSVTFTPAGGQTGTCQVNLVVTDGILATATIFNVSVTAASTLYIATLTPEGGHPSTGTGTASLQVSADGTRAVLRFQYSNLTSPKVSEHIHHGANNVNGNIIYDIDTPSLPSPPAQQADGSYLWIFDQTQPPASETYPPFIVSEIAAGQYYLNIHSANFPTGEIRGQFNAASGSQLFTPPAAAPTQPAAVPTTNDIARFLAQATFGAQLTDIDAASAVVTSNTLSDGTTNSYDAWLNAQFAAPITSIYGDVTTGAANPPWTFSARVNAELNGMSPDRVVDGWWHNALTAPDQLAQRVAFAYSEIFVISSVDGTTNFNSPGMASYHDMLAADAFGNFRQILGDVTLNPMMGQYLNMRGNTTQVLPAKPNENYAREIMQLFSIGLNLLQPDGTLKLDAIGLPIPSYNQTVIEGFAQLFTGYDLNGTVANIDKLPYLTTPSTTNSLQIWNNTYHSPMIPSSSGIYHSSYEKDLLSYTGNYVSPPGSGDRYFIAAVGGTQDTIATNLELNQGLDNIFNHPNVGPFICRELIQRLVGSTPSPAYIYRVAQIFADDGTAGHIRGNMKAVIRAILVDREARAPQTDAFPITKNTGYGHAREPVLCMSAGMRAFHPNSSSGYYKVSPTDQSLGQAPYRSPTVFNFFEPDYSLPGPIALAHLASPELDLTTENTSINYINMMYNGVYNSGNWPGGDVSTRLDTLDGFNVVGVTTTTGSATATIANPTGLAVGQTVIGNGIPAGTTIASIVPNILLTMSLNAGGSVTADSVTIGVQTFTTNISNANSTFILPGTTTGLAINQAMSDTGGVAAVPMIAGGTVLANFAKASSAVITLSAAATANNSNSSMTFGTQVVSANTTNGSATVAIANTSGLVVGQAVAGTGIPVLNYIIAINPNVSVTLSSAATATNTGINLQYSKYASEYQLADANVLTSPPPGVPAAAGTLAQLGLMDRLNLQLMGGQMSAATKTRIATYVNSLPTGSGGNDLARARAAVNLVLASPQFGTEK